MALSRSLGKLLASWLFDDGITCQFLEILRTMWPLLLKTIDLLLILKITGIPGDVRVLSYFEFSKISFAKQ